MFFHELWVHPPYSDFPIVPILEHATFGVAFWSKSTFTLFPIFLMILLPPTAQVKPSGSTGSEGGTDVPLGEKEEKKGKSKLLACHFLLAGWGGHLGEASLGDPSTSLGRDEEGWINV